MMAAGVGDGQRVTDLGRFPGEVGKESPPGSSSVRTSLYRPFRFAVL